MEATAPGRNRIGNGRKPCDKLTKVAMTIDCEGYDTFTASKSEHIIPSSNPSLKTP